MHSFTGVDFTAAREAFRDFCGANETKTGYLNAVKVAFVNFDDEVVGMILDKGLDLRIAALDNRVKAYLVNALQVSDDSMMSKGLWEAAGNPIVAEGSEPFDVNIQVSEKTCGLSIVMTAKSKGEEVGKTQNLILTEDYYDKIYKSGSSYYELLQNKYNALADVEGIETYRNTLKYVKDMAYISELEQCASNSDFKENSGYESPGKHWYGSYKDHDYEFINQNPEAMLEEIIDGRGGNGTANGYSRMSAQEVAIYNYLYKTDKSKAQDYNKDIDGISMQSIVAGVDQRIMSDAEGAWKYVYQGAKMTGAAAPAILVTVATSGTGAPAVIGSLGTAGVYGASSYGNTRTATLSQGYTWNTANSYATAMAAKDGAKTLILVGTGGITSSLGRKFAWSAGKNALAFGGMTTGI